jgi:hypothetical protein
MTARVHKGRRAGPRPSKFENGWNLPRYGRGRDWLVGVAAVIGALSVMRPVAVRNLRIG